MHGPLKLISNPRMERPAAHMRRSHRRSCGEAAGARVIRLAAAHGEPSAVGADPEFRAIVWRLGLAALCLFWAGAIWAIAG